MKCPAGGGAELLHDTSDVPHTYKGQTTTFSALSADFCPACGEILLDSAEADRYGASVCAFNKRGNAATVDSRYIAEVRKKLALDQREAGEIFAGDVNAFSRCENGKTGPPLALVKLLKLLDRHPELLDEVRSAQRVADGSSRGVGSLPRTPSRVEGRGRWPRSAQPGWADLAQPSSPTGSAVTGP